MPRAIVHAAGPDEGPGERVGSLEYDPLHLEALTVQVEALATGQRGRPGVDRLVAVTSGGRKLVEVKIEGRAPDAGEL